MASNLYLGIDAGGTKTHALIADDEGQVRGLGHAGTGNWEGVGLEGARAAYETALTEALAQAEISVGQLSAAGYGLAGFDWPSDTARLQPVVQSLGVPGPWVLVNDTDVALRAGTDDGVGVVIISGTGTTVAGCNAAGERWRTFGCGEDLGDTGGAGGLARLGLRAVARAYTGAGPDTLLTDLYVQHYQAESAIALLESFVREQVPRPSGRLAPLIFEAARQGDRAAQDVIRHVGREQGLNAAAIIRKLGMQAASFAIVLAGGVFRSRSQLLVEAIMEPVRAVAAGAFPRTLEAPPVVGGVLLAMEAAGSRPSLDLQQRLAREASQRLS
ncbi:MAG: BadF/BadG/BcrA/BcrD ATPase family protein [Anaerolineae bacterium]|jgi:N-acetylglucosamine kinase-like BadF-type ATPase|nr:ATPase [Chloroflexota bacterium]